MAKRIFFNDYYSSSDADATPAMHELLGDCRNGDEIVVDRGVYHFFSDFAPEALYNVSNHGVCGLKRIAIWLKNASGVSFEGNGARFVFHGVVIPFVIDGSEEITIRNLSISYAQPMHAQALITSASRDGLELWMETGHPYAIAGKRIFLTGHDYREPLMDASTIEMDAQTGAPAYCSGDSPLGEPINCYDAEEIESGRIRIRGPFARVPAEGNRLVLRGGKRYAPGIFMLNSRDVRISEVTFYHAMGMAIIGQRTDGIAIENTSVIPDAENGYVFSANADALHFVNCKGKISVTGCTFAGQMDDALNIHGIYVQAVKRLGERSLLARLVHNEQYGVEIIGSGDVLRFVRSGIMEPYAERAVDEVEALNSEAMVLRFAEPLPAELAPCDVMENISWSAELLLQDCVIKNNRARGVLISTPGKAEVRDNYFSVPGAAVLIAGDANYWFESGAVTDVEIRGNVIEDCCYVPQWGAAPFIIRPEISRSGDGNFCYHGKIRISGNTIRAFSDSLLYALSVDKLVFDNTVVRTCTHPPFQKAGEKFVLSRCREATTNIRDGSAKRE
jgi:hypothetical protein